MKNPKLRQQSCCKLQVQPDIIFLRSHERNCWLKNYLFQLPQTKVFHSFPTQHSTICNFSVYLPAAIASMCMQFSQFSHAPCMMRIQQILFHSVLLRGYCVVISLHFTSFGLFTTQLQSRDGVKGFSLPSASALPFYVCFHFFHLL